MPCPTCTGTMANLGLDQAGRQTFYCERCGTCKTEVADGPVHITVPRLAYYAREAAGMSQHHPQGIHHGWVVPAWHWVAICEAVGHKL